MDNLNKKLNKKVKESRKRKEEEYGKQGGDLGK